MMTTSVAGHLLPQWQVHVPAHHLDTHHFFYPQGPPAMPSISTAKKQPTTPPQTASTTKCIRTKVTGPGSVAEVANALRDVAAQLNTDSEGTLYQKTPQQ
jgi:hypothetical protein